MCTGCFDVEDEDGKIEDGTKGVAGCIWWDNGDVSLDTNFYGTIEATGGSNFRFLPKKENDWDTDSTLGWVYEHYAEKDGEGMNEEYP